MTDHESFFEELKRDVDTDHRRIDGAGSPPASMWKSIRAHVTPDEHKEETTMIVSNVKPGVFTPMTSPASESRGRVRHTLSLAASFLIVMSVALGGWFASTQLNQPGGTDGHFALLGQVDDSATCDVEPMTVDGVMEIVENPYRYMDEDDYPKPWGSSNPPTPWEDDYQEVFPRLSSPIGTGYGDEPTQTAFDDASAVISRYIACLQEDGSVAMMLRFSDPFSIQHHIRMEFPFYRSEDQVREYVTEWLQSGDQYHSLEFERQGEMLTFRQSDQKSGAGTQIHDFGMGFDQIIYIGSEVYQESGEFIGYYHPNVRQISGENLNYGMLFTLLHSRYTGEWYVVTDGRWLISGDV